MQSLRSALALRQASATRWDGCPAEPDETRYKRLNSSFVCVLKDANYDLICCAFQIIMGNTPLYIPQTARNMSDPNFYFN